MRVVVTKTDINLARIEVAGGGAHTRCCPIAQSLRRRGFQHVEVDRTWIRWRVKGQFRCVQTPGDVLPFMRAFDFSRQVRPMQFELEATP